MAFICSILIRWHLFFEYHQVVFGVGRGETPDRFGPVAIAPLKGIHKVGGGRRPPPFYGAPHGYEPVYLSFFDRFAIVSCVNVSFCLWVSPWLWAWDDLIHVWHYIDSEIYRIC